jgi:hypothetical protein
VRKSYGLARSDCMIQREDAVRGPMKDKLKLNAQNSWLKLLNPDELRPTLIAASVYIATFESLKATITDRLKDFYTKGFDEKGWRVDPNYTVRVLSRNSSPTHASLDWLKEMNAIDDADIATYGRVKDLRNVLAHGLLSVISDGLPAEFAERLTEMATLLDKIERWWIVNVEIATDPDLSGADIDEAKIVPGPVMALRLLLDIALGSEVESKFYLEEFRKRAGSEGR